jgi:type I restriction enzyme S subunit
MKNGWPVKRLGDVSEIIMGQSPDGDSYNTTGEGVPLINGPVEFSDESFGKTIRSKFTTQPTKFCKEGDLILCVRGSTTGRMNIAGFDACVGRGVAAIRAKQYQPWINHFIGSKRDEIHGKGTGSTFPNVSGATLANLELVVPPFSEQQRIVGLLDKAFAGLTTAKANAEKNLRNARALFESHLQSVLQSKKWKWKTLGELCDGVEYGSSAKSKKEGKIPVLRMGNIQDGKLDWENLVYTDDKEEIAKYLLRHNDVLFNRTNSPELVGKTAIYKSEMPAIFAGYLIRIHRKEDLLDADYLNYFLNSQVALDYGKTVVISSVNQANINGAKLKGYPIPAPSVAEQRAIVKTLDRLQKETQRLGNIYEQKLAALEALKKSLLHQAFTGQLHGHAAKEAESHAL